jgi:hypothetical protein
MKTIIPVAEMIAKREKALQEFLAKHKESCIENINKEIYKNGRAIFVFFKDKTERRITREMSIALANELSVEYQAQGYKTFIDTYAETNKEKDCALIVRLPD